MAEKMPDSSRPEMTRSSSYLDSIYGKGSLELAWGNGQLHVQQGGSSSSATRMTPSCDEGSLNARSARLSSLYDLPVQKDSGHDNSQRNSHQSNDQNSLQLALERVEEIKARWFAKAASSSKGPDHSLVIDSSKGSQILTGLERQNPLISDASNSVPRSEETPPDEQSEAVGHNSAISIHGQYYNQTSSAGLKAKGKADTKYFDEALLESSSLCSLGASNNRNVCSSRKHDDIHDSTYLSDNDEEPEDVAKEKPAREGTGVKRSRNSETHNLCERKRRDKINKRMRMLKELIPNCNKMDKASMLDDAIEYLKTLKLQLQIMTMSAGFCMPFMMLPNATHPMMNTPHLHQLMGVGMGFRPGTAIPCSLPQFPITPLPAGITDNTVQMFAFPNQVPHMPISHAPFIPMVGNSSTQPPLATSTTTNLAENPASSQLTTLMASVPKNSHLSEQAEYATIRFPFTTSHQFVSHKEDKN
ncbi:Transcription factor PIL1, partial [Mucuna pruriens]